MNLKETLVAGPTEVTFTKNNGDTRVMLCTLDPAMLPELTSTTESTRTKPVGHFNVIDLEKNEWRSFNEDQVIAFKAI
jgi:hypothetical protein